MITVPIKKFNTGLLSERLKSLGLPPILHGAALVDYVHQHGRVARTYGGIDPDGGTFIELGRPLHVYKRVDVGRGFARGLASLLIEPGELVHVPNSVKQSDGRASSFHSRKMRASGARVVKIVDVPPELSLYLTSTWPRSLASAPSVDTCGPLRTARSTHSESFVYQVGQRVYPTHLGLTDEARLREFKRTTGTCAMGIHFFINVGDALTYY